VPLSWILTLWREGGGLRPQARTCFWRNEVRTSLRRGTCLNEGTLDFDPEAQDLAKLASLARPSEERPNIPGYELDRRIGEGSFGEVWSGVQLSTRQKVAVKLLHRTDLGALTYLEREVSRLAHVTEHPNLLTLIDANLQHVPAFLVTPLLSSTLEAYLTQSLSIRTSVKWMREVAEALNYIHHRGILHCDLKPGNLLLDQEGRVRGVDFGQAHLLEQGGGSLLDLAMARTGRGLSGGVEFVLDAKTLKSLREGLRQPRT